MRSIASGNCSSNLAIRRLAARLRNMKGVIPDRRPAAHAQQKLVSELPGGHCSEERREGGTKNDLAQ